MRTVIVYIVVSDEHDIYLEQTCLSMHSLRLYNPGAKIIAVMDKCTEVTLYGNRKMILDYISEKIIVNPEGKFSKMQISRFIKTNLRKYVSGDYLFVDSDTIITSSLDEIDLCPYKLAAVKDGHCSLKEHQCYRKISKELNSVDCVLEDDIYYNSGVLYVKDDEENYRFYESWHINWLCSGMKGIWIDQPSLAKTNAEFGCYIKELGSIWNCQIIRNGLPYLIEAKIIHYFSSIILKGNNVVPYYFMKDEVYYEIKNNGKVPTYFNDLICHSKELFSPQIELISGDRVKILYTKQFYVLYIIFFSMPLIFSFFEFFANIIFCFLKWIKKCKWL